MTEQPTKVGFTYRTEATDATKETCSKEGNLHLGWRETGCQRDTRAGLREQSGCRLGGQRELREPQGEVVPDPTRSPGPLLVQKLMATVTPPRGARTRPYLFSSRH